MNNQFSFDPPVAIALVLRSPGLVKRIDPTKSRTDPELGLVFSVQDLEDLFQVKAEFNLNEYAIELPAPWLEAPFDRGETAEAPVVSTGLPRIRAPSTTVTAISQRWNTTDSGTGSTRTKGDFTAIGTVLQGSWFVRANQPNTFESNTWQLAEATYIRQTDRQDYIVGSQPPFWLQQGLADGDYWGFTTIVRRGFKPPTELYGGTDVRRRLQSNQISRSISGRAAPGTLVRLVQSLSDRPIAEVLVDSSGIFRFDNLQLGNQSFGGFYQVLLYPQGQLTAPPEIRDATFLNPQEQLPEGEAVYLDNPELLIILNNRPLKLLQSDTSGDRVLVRLPPGTVRLDLDPAGFPPDWQATGEAYAVDVVAGSYTSIEVPLIPAYTIAGVVVDSKGQPIGGARIEAISTTTGQKVFSVTNDAGVYYLERLQSGIYSLQINGKAARPDTIKLDRSARPLQELNLTLP
ncbi:MAG: carboxypeptidase-like regulatory domain-containing protein [Cyanosarcina radialis HA8281-LM2]|nr:carboxypeptidase-like regulatory domain-containing protein [Cyanosarcina radialis HA8281-LM2]